MGAAVALEVVEAAAGNAPAWQEAHEKLVALAEQRAGLDADEGRWLQEALRSGTHVRLGYGGFNEYVERLRDALAKLRRDAGAPLDDEVVRAIHASPPPITGELVDPGACAVERRTWR